MAATRPQRVKRNPKQDAIYYSSLGKDKDGFCIKYINAIKGDFLFNLTDVILLTCIFLCCTCKSFCPLIWLLLLSGRGVFSQQPFRKGDFLFEYRGDVINKKEHKSRLKQYRNEQKVFLFEFRYNGQLLWYVKFLYFYLYI